MNANRIYSKILAFSISIKLLCVTQLFLEVGKYNVHGVLGSVLSDRCSRQRRIYTQPFGIISDGNQEYDMDSHCEWLIKANNTNQFITLKFIQMVTECSYDHLFIYDGDSYNDTLLGSFSGSTVPPSITASSGYMLIMLFSDTNYIRDGFTAEYFVSDCPQNCSSHGKCVNHKCNCQSMWNGSACQHDLCPELCGENEGRGKCEILAGMPHCVCNNGFSGQSCNLPQTNSFKLEDNKWFKIAEQNTGLSDRAGHAGVYLAYSDKFYVFGGYNLNYAFGDLLNFDFNDNKWFNMSHFIRGEAPSARFGHAMCEYDGNLVVFGGSNMSYHFNDLWLFNVSSNSWSIKALNSIFHPPALSKHSLTLVDDQWLFVMGGQLSGGRFSSALYKISLKDDEQWIKIKVTGGKELDHRLIGHSCVFHRPTRSLVIYGGISTDSARFSKLANEMHLFNVDHNFWTQVHFKKGSSMKNSVEDWIPMERAFHSANIIGSYMIVYGGYSHRHSQQEICYDNQLYFYHLDCHTWVDNTLFQIPSVGTKSFAPRGSFSHASAVRNGTTLLICGGYSGNVRSDLNAYVVPPIITRLDDSNLQKLCKSYSDRNMCKSNPDCGWCRASSTCVATPYSKECASDVEFGSCPGLCPALNDCQSCLLFGKHVKNPSTYMSDSCSWCVQSAQCHFSQPNKKVCWSSSYGITGWWGSNTTDITKFKDCRFKDFRPGLTWIKYRYPKNYSQPDEVSITRKTAQIFAIDPMFAKEVDAGGVFTSKFIGFIHPLGAKPKAENSLIVFMGSSESSAILKMSFNSSSKFAEQVANHTASVHYSSTRAHRPNNKVLIFPNPSVGHKYYVDFEAKQSIVRSLQARMNASMQLEWNGFRRYRDVFSVEFLEPYRSDDCDVNTNCLQCLSNSACGWHERLHVCIHRFDLEAVASNDMHLNLDPEQCNVCPDYIYCHDCLKGANCEWLVEEAICVRGGRFQNAVRDLASCPVACHQRSSCVDCLGLPGRCAWCEQSQSCFLFSTYTTYFQFGACREWVDEDHVVLNRMSNNSTQAGAQCRDCSLHKTCKSCLEDLSCGWCGNRRNPTYGVCVRGDFKHPYEGNCAAFVSNTHNISDVEPADWSYSACPDVDECGLQLHNCHDNATCINTLESYKCHCNKGFEGDGILSCDRKCYEDCLNGECSDAPDYKCICELGWTGPACDIDCGCHNHSTCETGVGHCDQCLEYTEGASCEHCQVGSYGDATTEIGCHSCNCNSHHNKSAGICDTITGKCFCQDQTTGPKCERCKPGFYGDPTDGGLCYRKCEPRAVVTDLKSGGLGSGGLDAEAQSCLWILSVFDDFDAEMVVTRKTRSTTTADAIVLEIHSDIDVPCHENSVYVYDGFPEFMASKSRSESSMGKLIGRFCKTPEPHEMIVKAMSGFMTIYFEKSRPSHRFNASYSVLKCEDGCNYGNYTCLDGSCRCQESYYGIKCDQPLCPNNCNLTKDKVGRLLSYCNKEMGQCICQNGYGGPDCSVRIKHGDIVLKTVFNPETMQDGQAKPAKSLPRVGHSFHALNNGNILMFGGYSLTFGYLNDLYIIDVTKNSWNKVYESGNKPAPRYLHASAYIASENKLLIYGGLNQNTVFDDFWMFDIDNHSWTQLQKGEDLPPLAGHTLTYIGNNQLVLIGGFSPQHGFSQNVHIYDLQKDAWTVQNVGGAVPIGIYGHTAVYHEKTSAIYVFGGYLYKIDETLISDELYALLIDSYDWTRLPVDIKVTLRDEKPITRYFHAAVSTENDMVILGGANKHSNDAVMIYNYKCNIWIPLNYSEIEVVGEPLEASHGLAATYLNQSIYIYGGMNGVMHQKMTQLKLPDMCAIHSHSRLTCLKHIGCSYCSVYQKDGTNLSFCYNNDHDPPRACYDPSGTSERSEGYSCNAHWLNNRNCYQYTSCSECLAQWPAHRNATRVCQWCTNCQVGKCIKAGNVCEEENNCNLQQRVTKNATQCPERLCPASDCEKCGKNHKCMWTRHVLRSSELGRTLNQLPIYNWTCVRKIIQDASSFPIMSMPPLQCPIRCHHFNSCDTCVVHKGAEGGWHSCAWSHKLQMCMSPSYQLLRCSFGECGSILEGSAVAFKSNQCAKPCHLFEQSQTCLSNPNCGWCSFSGQQVDGRGLCLQGGLYGPLKGACSSTSITIGDGIPLTDEVTKWITLSSGPPMWSYLRAPPENECLNGHHNCDEEREECIDTLKSFECQCRPGYLPSKEGKCKPVCNQGCVYGNCIEPDVCKCLFGYVGHNCSIQCQCNGQSDCAGPSQLDKCLECHNNTQGSQCEKCKPFFVGNPRKNIKCISCQVFCNGHSEICLSPEFFNTSSVLLSSVYVQPELLFHHLDMSDIRDMVTEGPESEAICLNCQHNTVGDRCEQCDSGYFRTGDSTRNECRPCECHGHSDICDPTNGENCKCQNHTETEPQCIPKTSKNAPQPCWKHQCSKCKEYFLGTPINGHQCYRHMFVEKDYCFDPYTQDECSRRPSPLMQGRTVFFAVQPKYMNVDIRIVVDVSLGGVDFYFSAKEDTFVVNVNKTSGIHYVSIDERYGLQLDDENLQLKSFQSATNDVYDSVFIVNRSAKDDDDDSPSLNLTERYQQHKLKDVTSSEDELNKFVRINDPEEFLVIRNLRNRLVITVPLEVHDLRSTRFYMVLRGIGSEQSNFTFGSLFFRQDQPRIDLFVFFSVFFSCFFLFLAICVVMWKVKQMMDHRQAQQRHAEEMKHMASRPFAKVYVIIDDSDPDDFDFMVPPSMYSSPSHPAHKKGRNRHLVYTQSTRDAIPKIPLLPVEEKYGVRAISIEPTFDNLAAVSTVLMQLPGGVCTPVRLTLCSTLVNSRSFPHSHGGGNGLRTYIRRRTSNMNV